MTLYLIRHGETADNAARVLQLPDARLSERGVEQARRLAARLADSGIRCILASDFRRAAMTAEALRDATRAELLHEPLLQERNFGRLRGTAYADLPGDLFAPDFEPPEGESVAMFHERVARAWAAVQRLAAALDGPLAVVTHGLVCRALVERHMQLAAELVARGLPRAWGNCSLTHAERVPPDPRWQVRVLDCRAHLADLPA